MNSFFTYPFTVTHIVLCTRVPAGAGTPCHRNRQSHGLVYKCEGRSGYRFLNGPVMEVEEGQVFYLPKFSDYDVLNIHTGACIAVNFELSDPKLTFPPFSMPKKLASKYKGLFSKLPDYFGQDKPGGATGCMMTLYQILHEIQQDHFRRYSTQSHLAPAEKGAALLRERLSDPELTVTSVCDALNISEGYFRRLFLQMYGISPRQFLIRQRIEKAKELLLSRNDSCCQIGQLCGFDSGSYFSREFHRQTGMTASEFRKSL